MRRICVFDVNETLLDLTVLDAPFERAFDRPGVRREWFGQLLQNSGRSGIREPRRRPDDAAEVMVAGRSSVVVQRRELDDGARDIVGRTQGGWVAVAAATA